MPNPVRVEHPKHPRFKDLTGRTYGRLTVLWYAGNEAGRTNWVCSCSCGSQTTVQGKRLVSGHTRSCGCLVTQTCIERSVSHGRTGTPLYNIWKGILWRCLRQKAKAYLHYGGRGITMAEEFMDFLVFEEYVTGILGWRHEKGITIDRKDNSKGYIKGNLRLATYKEQNRNRRSNHYVQLGGETMPLITAVELTGVVSYSTAIQRINKCGWSVEQALHTPKAMTGKTKRPKEV